jgi:hypothetical protein
VNFIDSKSHTLYGLFDLPYKYNMCFGTILDAGRIRTMVTAQKNGFLQNKEEYNSQSTDRARRGIIIEEVHAFLVSL